LSFYSKKLVRQFVACCNGKGFIQNR